MNKQERMNEEREIGRKFFVAMEDAERKFTIDMRDEYLRHRNAKTAIQNAKAEEIAKAEKQRQEAFAKLPPIDESPKQNPFILPIDEMAELTPEEQDAVSVNKQLYDELWDIAGQLQELKHPDAYDKGFVGFQEKVSELSARAHELFLKVLNN